MVLGKDREYTLKVWGNSATPLKYEIMGRPLIGNATNDVAIVFETSDGKEVMVSSKCKWVLEEK